MFISGGALPSAKKIVIYGPEGIGKSTMASKFPQPVVFIDTEGSTRHMDVLRTPAPTSWLELMNYVGMFINDPSLAATLVIDTADWAERLCVSMICQRAQVDGLEGFGYGKGYVYLAEEFGKLLDKLQQLTDKGVNVVITAHAQMRKFEEPNETGTYDRWELKLGKKTSPMVKEWADMVLFVNYKVNVVNVDGKGAQAGKNKVQGGRRVMYATHHPCWDAKNRFGLPDEMQFDYSEIARIFKDFTPPVNADPVKAETPPPPQRAQMAVEQPQDAPEEKQEPKPKAKAKAKEDPPQPPTEDDDVRDVDGSPIDPELAALMKHSGITASELYLMAREQNLTAEGQYVHDFPEKIVKFLIKDWQVALGKIQEFRAQVPF